MTPAAGDSGSAAAAAPARLVIIGAGGLGREVLEVVLDINDAAAASGGAPAYAFLGYLDDGEVPPEPLDLLGVRLLGPSTLLADLDTDYVIAISAPAARRRIDAAARAAGSRAVSLVHPAATVGRDAELDEGVILAAGVRVTTHVRIGRHTHVNMNCTIGHDAELGPFATLFAGVHLGGSCVIEEDVTLGTGCVILPGIRVGRGAVVGAGATVVRDVDPYSTVVVPPARPTIGRATPDLPA